MKNLLLILAITLALTSAKFNQKHRVTQEQIYQQYTGQCNGQEKNNNLGSCGQQCLVQFSQTTVNEKCTLSQYKCIPCDKVDSSLNIPNKDQSNSSNSSSNNNKESTKNNKNTEQNSENNTEKEQEKTQNYGEKSFDFTTIIDDVAIVLGSSLGLALIYYLITGYLESKEKKSYDIKEGYQGPSNYNKSEQVSKPTGSFVQGYTPSAQVYQAPTSTTLTQTIVQPVSHTTLPQAIRSSTSFSHLPSTTVLRH